MDESTDIFRFDDYTRYLKIIILQIFMKNMIHQEYLKKNVSTILATTVVNPWT